MAEETGSMDRFISMMSGKLDKIDRSIVSAMANDRAQSTPSNQSSGAAPSFNAGGGAPAPPRFTNYSERQNFSAILGTAFKGFSGMAGAVSMALPTTQEAVDAQALADRMRFYGRSPYNTTGKAMASQLQASFMGTATSPMDAALASNYAAQRGLLPGLDNFGAGKNYAGVLGGAALASNLTPGLGLTGGVGVMASLNDPKMVNMARMFGIQMRNSKGTGMTDLSSIIKQLYDILGGKAMVTKQNIAISAMPGNALDSILNQYFGLDPNVRSTVLSGLTQMAAAGTSDENVAFTRSNILASGGLTKGIISTGYRATSEMNLIQKFSGRTQTNLIGANNVLTGLYGNLAGREGGTSALDKGVQGISNLSTILETLGGARGGAGQLFMDSLFDMTEGAAKGTFLGLNKITNAKGKMIGKVGALGLGAFAASKGIGAFKNQMGNGNPNAPFDFTGEAGINPSTIGPTYTGAITINVSGGSDQFAIADAITAALGASM